MLKIKRFLEGEKINVVLVDGKLENLKVEKIENKAELDSLISELKHLKSSLERTNLISLPTIKEEVMMEKGTPQFEEKETVPKNRASSYGVKLTKNKEATKKNETKDSFLPNEIKDALNENFPDKVINISDLRLKHISLYSKLTKIAKEKGLSPKEFLLENGYGYLRKQRNKTSDWDEDKYLSLLKETYPQKEIPAKEFRIERDGLMYNLALSFSRKHDMNVEQYLNSLGFQYTKKRLKAV